MKIRTIIIAVSFAVWAVPAQAQYKEMSKVEELAKSNSEQEMLTELSRHLGVPSDTLKQEMTSNNLSFSQLYIAHTIAKAANADLKSIISDSKTKPWPTIAEENKVDKKKIAADFEELEKTFKNSKKAK